MTTSITPLDAANISSGTGGSIPVGKEINVASRAVTGGTLYITTVRGAADTDPAGVATAFVPASAVPAARQLRLSEGKSDLGVPMTAAAGTPTGTLGISRTAGTSLVLVGEATSSSAKTDKVMFETVLPDTYIAGAAITIAADANYTTTGTVTAASTTLNMAMYAESVAGVEAAVTVTGGAQQFTASAASYSWTVSAVNAAAASLVAGMRVVFELTMLVTTSAGAATGQLNSLSFTA